MWCVMCVCVLYYIKHRRVVDMPNSGLRPTPWHIKCSPMFHMMHQVVVDVWLTIIERTSQFPQQLGNGHFAGRYAIYALRIKRAHNT